MALFTGGRSIPFLKDIPGIGKLFRNRDTTVRESELVVFITPTIVTYDECPTGRYGAALDTADCWLHRVPWAEGCPAPGGPEGCDVCDTCEGEPDGYESPEGVFQDESQVQPQRLPKVDDPVLPPSDSSTRSSRRRHHVDSEKESVPETTPIGRVARRTPALPPKPRQGGRVDLLSRNVSSIPPRPVLEQKRGAAPQVGQRPDPSASTQPEPPQKRTPLGAGREQRSDKIPRIKLARRPAVLSHDAPAGRSDIPRRLPPVVTRVQYQTTESMREPYGSRFRATRKNGDQSLNQTEVSTRLPRVARNPSVAPEVAARQSSEGAKKLPAVFDAFRP